MTDIANVDFNKVKLAGTYSTNQLVEVFDDEANVSSLDRRFFYVVYDEIPKEDLDIVIHLIIASHRGFMYIGRTTHFGDDAERFYLTSLFLLPAMEDEFNENSLISHIVHNDSVRKTLEYLKNILAEKPKHRELSSILWSLFSMICGIYPVNKIKVYDTMQHQKAIKDIKDDLDCEMMNLSSIGNRIAYPQYLDFVYGQNVEWKTYFEWSLSENRDGIDEKIVAQSAQFNKNHISWSNAPRWALHPFLNLIFLMGVYVLLLIPSTLFFWAVNSFNMYGISKTGIIIMSLVYTLSLVTAYSTEYAFKKDKITLKVCFNPFTMDKDRLVMRGRWSYFRFVEYGTFRKWGVKYIYFSKKHMTDAEFKEFRRKMIPYDYDSIAVPYRKDYMKIAENLVFATRKDR